MSLKNKYRPKTLDEVLGNEATKDTIQKFGDDIPHTILLEGLTGCGKTTLAWIIARQTGCVDDEIRYYNTSNTRGIDTIRQIDTDTQYAPVAGDAKAFILDECHKITNDGQNALLTLLDEPPSHVYFFLATTQPERLIKEITKGRAVRLKVEPLSYPLMNTLINSVVQAEGKNGTFPRSATRAVALRAEGIPRNALTLLESVINMTDMDKIERALDSVTLEPDKVIDLCRVLVETRKNRWPDMAKIIKQISPADAEDARWIILGYLRTTLLNTGDIRIAEMMEFFKDSFVMSGHAGLAQACYLAFTR